MDNPLSFPPRESPSDPCAAYYYSFLVHIQRDTMLSRYLYSLRYKHCGYYIEQQLKPGEH